MILESCICVYKQCVSISYIQVKHIRQLCALNFCYYACFYFEKYITIVPHSSKLFEFNVFHKHN